MSDIFIPLSMVKQMLFEHDKYKNNPPEVMGYQLCVKYVYRGLEVSMGLDSNLSAENDLFRGDIRVFAGKDSSSDITRVIWGEESGAIYASVENLRDTFNRIDAYLGPEDHPGRLHHSHTIRSSDSSAYDVICDKCGAHDGLGTWGGLVFPCSKGNK